MKQALLLLAAALGAHGQTCAYHTGKFPVGQIIVYRNGAILRQGADFTYKVTAGVPTITPLVWAPGDKFSTVFSINIPLTLPNGTAYASFRQWQENWDCLGIAATSPKLAGLDQCNGSGPSPADASTASWDPAAMYSVGSQVAFNSFLWASIQASNIANQPDSSPLWWKIVKWDCSGLLRAIITLPDGSILMITGVAGALPGNGTWTPIQ